MSFPETAQIPIPNDGAVPPLAVAGVGPEVRIDQWAPGSKGYDIVRDPGAGFTANLEGSVNGRHWTVIVGLAASGEGAIPTHLNLLRANVSIGGALGATTDVRAAGVCQ